MVKLNKCSFVSSQRHNLLAKVRLSGMSFCWGSVNCHFSGEKIYHFCESPKSFEMFTGVKGGGGHQWSPTHLINESPVELSVPLFRFGPGA